MRATTTGAVNIGIGVNSMAENTTGCHNVVVGTSGLQCNTSGCQNIVMGLQAMRFNQTGDFNTAIGHLALCKNTTADNNTAVGFEALKANTTGAQNTGIGRIALLDTTTGQGNTAVGNQAGQGVTTGDNNLTLGSEAGRSSSPFNLTTEDNRMILGNNSITNFYAKVGLTATSDARDKMNFETVPHGLDFVNQLQPYKFNFRKSREIEAPHGNAKYGFKAQDVLALEGDNPVIINNENEENLKITDSHLIPVLVNAIKELSETNKNLKSRIEVLENE